MPPNGDVYEGDCLGALAELVALGLTVQSVVTDPPYQYNFMGRSWDRDTIAFQPEVWRHCLDLLPPGGHLVAFGGTRTYHRLACAVEDAGFQVIDAISWIYGQGFPKSRDVSKAIDKSLGVEREVIGQNPNARDPIANAAHLDRWEQGYGRSVARLASVAGFAGAERAEQSGGYERVHVSITAPASAQARQWAGYGTALKPAHELICLARKPLRGTVAANVLQHGVGGLNIDGCRVACSDKTPFPEGITSSRGQMLDAMSSRPRPGDNHLTGRWPANVCHDGSDEVLAGFPYSKGQQGDVRGDEPSHIGDNGIYGHYGKTGVLFPKRGDTGSAARFFYCAKASKKERNGSKHQTIKPVSLMRWLVGMVTPPGGLVLDPFAGTGTTAEAAYLEGCDYLLIERDPQYVQDIERRFKRVTG